MKFLEPGTIVTIKPFSPISHSLTHKVDGLVDVTVCDHDPVENRYEGFYTNSVHHDVSFHSDAIVSIVSEPRTMTKLKKEYISKVEFMLKATSNYFP